MDEYFTLDMRGKGWAENFFGKRDNKKGEDNWTET